jgi:hypothetical protein
MWLPFLLGTDPSLPCTDPSLPCPVLQAHARVLEEAYSVFEGITQYHSDLLLLLQQLGDGVFLHASLETLLMVRTSSQLV